MTAGPYSRLYHSLVDDPMFEGIYDDDAAFATWVRLLIVADGMYPATAPIPRTTRPKPLQKLITAGLVEVLPGERYRVRGLNAERDRRSQAASASAQLRWSTPRREGGRPASRGTRFRVLQRDSFTCRYCGQKAPDVVLDVDHVVPVRVGGSDEIDNLVAACVDCNTGKSGHGLDMRADTSPNARASSPADARALLEKDETRRDETSIDANASEPTNGEPPPQTFMGFQPRKPKPGAHEGQHPDCQVCAPLRPKAAGA